MRQKGRVSVEYLLEYVRPTCSEQVPEQLDWETVGAAKVEYLIEGLSKIASTSFCPTTLQPTPPFQ